MSTTCDFVIAEESLPLSDIEAGPDPERSVKPGLASTVHDIISKVLKETGIYSQRDGAYVSLVQKLAVIPPGGDALVVDVGCGHGRILSSFQGRCRRLGVDLKRSRLATFIDPAIPRLQGDAEGLPLRDHSVDILLALSLVEHLPNQEAFFGEVARVLRNGGIAVLQIPNLRYLIEPHTKWPLLFMWNESLRNEIMTASGCDVNLSTSVDSVVHMAADAGLSVDQVFPIWHMKIARLLWIPMGHFLVVRSNTTHSVPPEATMAAPVVSGS